MNSQKHKRVGKAQRGVMKWVEDRMLVGKGGGARLNSGGICAECHEKEDLVLEGFGQPGEPETQQRRQLQQ